MCDAWRPGQAEMRCFRSDKYVEVDVDLASALNTSQVIPSIVRVCCGFGIQKNIFLV